MTASPERAPRGVLDTGIFIASETGRMLNTDALPEEAAISPITVGELHAGVLAAKDLDVRARRLATLESVLDIEQRPIDEAVARSWALLGVHLAEKKRRLNVNDLWIAATALTHSIAVVTQDEDFAPVTDVAGLDVLRVWSRSPIRAPRPRSPLTALTP